MSYTRVNTNSIDNLLFDVDRITERSSMEANSGNAPWPLARHDTTLSVVRAGTFRRLTVFFVANGRRVAISGGWTGHRPAAPDSHTSPADCASRRSYRSCDAHPPEGVSVRHCSCAGAGTGCQRDLWTLAGCEECLRSPFTKTSHGYPRHLSGRVAAVRAPRTATDRRTR